MDNQLVAPDSPHSGQVGASSPPFGLPDSQWRSWAVQSAPGGIMQWMNHDRSSVSGLSTGPHGFDSKPLPSSLSIFEQILGKINGISSSLISEASAQTAFKGSAEKQPSPVSVPDYNPLPVASPSSDAAGAFGISSLSQGTHNGFLYDSLQPQPVPGDPVLRLRYDEFPRVQIIQSRAFQPQVHVRRSSHPAVHIYSNLFVSVQDDFDVEACFQQLGRPRWGGSHDNDGSQEFEPEGLMNPYLLQKQPTVFFHQDATQKRTSRQVSTTLEKNYPRDTLGDVWRPFICIDTTPAWWPCIQFGSASTEDGKSPSGAWQTFSIADEHGGKIILWGPIKPLSIDLPY